MPLIDSLYIANANAFLFLPKQQHSGLVHRLFYLLQGQTQGSKGPESEERTLKCPRLDNTVAGSNNQSGKGHRNVYWLSLWIKMQLGANNKEQMLLETLLVQIGWV
jgi:hypothetical protein